MSLTPPSVPTPQHFMWDAHLMAFLCSHSFLPDFTVTTLRIDAALSAALVVMCPFPVALAWSFYWLHGTTTAWLVNDVD